MCMLQGTTTVLFHTSINPEFCACEPSAAAAGVDAVHNAVFPGALSGLNDAAPSPKTIRGTCQINVATSEMTMLNDFVQVLTPR